jgi:hypothetical protein
MRIPSTSLLKEDLTEHVKANEARYLRNGIVKIHVTVADNAFDRLADYVTKTVKRGWVDPDDVLALPRSVSEMRTSGMVLSPRDRAIRDISSTNVSAELAEQIYNFTVTDVGCPKSCSGGSRSHL